MIDTLAQALFDLAVLGAAHRHDGALTRANDARHHRHVVANDVVKKQRFVGLIHQRGNVADIDRLTHVDHFSGATQAVEKFAEIFREGCHGLLQQCGDMVGNRQRRGKAR